ncbi:GATA transcription factor 26-like [Dioscorea cayenensis subsp. rotundata]|uniref:GATA transcription factor 26-like n=1 Tax=Dioscorea cayennensis subsp. rotundata TaxID=55577 RepID=A0AB40BNJ9_DIOCR|nr:GATA transcription factor 26-like [Dioscorea cayenensis subsp. rotundata]
MVKEGPCCHCGVTRTPLWRNGPAHKPVLCNACGSRWRTKGTLENYVPQHARELTDQVEPKVSKEKITPLKNNLQRVQKRKLENVIPETEETVALNVQNFRKVLDEDAGYQSISGTATSCSESRIHDIIDLRASAQFCGWNVPSRKRSYIHRTRSSPLARLQKDLYSIFSAQGSSSTSMASDGDLLYGTKTQTQSGSIEIGHGVVLIRPPSSKVAEEESKAGSFLALNQSYIANETNSRSASYSVSTGCIDIEKSKEHIAELGQEHEKRDETLYEMLNIKHDRKSPLMSIDLNVLKHKENTLEDRASALKHSSPAPFKRQNDPVLKGSMGIPVGKCGPSGLSICSKTLTNSSDAASRLTHTGDTLTGNKDGNSMLSSFQLTVQDIHLSVPANTSTSNSEAKNLSNPYKGKTVKKASFEGHGSNSSQPKHRGPNNVTTNAALFECSNVCL